MSSAMNADSGNRDGLSKYSAIQFNIEWGQQETYSEVPLSGRTAYFARR